MNELMLFLLGISIVNPALNGKIPRPTFFPFVKLVSALTIRVDAVMQVSIKFGCGFVALFKYCVHAANII